MPADLFHEFTTMATTTLYGIKNCDTVKKARKWLDQAKVDYTFHDFREDGLDKKQARQWLDALGWETLVNKRSTTWKQLDSAQREAMDKSSALQAILKHPTLIKRPLLDLQGNYYVGFKESEYQQLFK